MQRIPVSVIVLYLFIVVSVVRVDQRRRFNDATGTTITLLIKDNKDNKD